MTKLCGKLWFRILAAFVAGPMIMTISAMVTLFFCLLVLQNGYVTFSDILPTMNTFFILVAAGLVMLLPPLIATEIVNRRRQPLPPGLCAAFLALLAIFSMVGLAAAMQIVQRIHLGGNWQTGVAILAACYAGAASVSLAIVSPFIRRWRQRSATVAEIAENF